VPFLTDGIAGCTAVFKEVEIVAFDPVSVNDLTGPETFVGIAKVVVLVTSPLVFVVTPGRVLADGVGVEICDGEGESVADALTLGFGEGVAVADAVTVGEGDAEGDGEAEAVEVSVDPPPPPKPPPPPPPELPLDVADALGVGVGEALGATVAIGAAVTFKLPDSVENGLIPTPLVEAILAV